MPRLVTSPHRGARVSCTAPVSLALPSLRDVPDSMVEHLAAISRRYAESIGWNVHRLDHWMLQLTTIRDAGASGIIFWGGYRTPWDDTQDWWHATLDFIGAM